MLRKMQGTAADYLIETGEVMEDSDERSMQDIFMAQLKSCLHNWFGEDDGANLNDYLHLGVQKPR